jgi:uncharacterized protein
MTVELATIYMHTSAGRKYYPFAPTPDQVDIGVIAHHLATRARWAGATQHPKFKERILFSVAEHSIYVADYVEYELGRPDLALAALLHDGSEAFNGDLIRPLKYSPEFSEPFKQVEILNEAAVEARFNVIEQMKQPEIKIADDAVCYAEWLQIVPTRQSEGDWEQHFKADKPANIEIEMMLPYQAKEAFLDRFYQIKDRMKGAK